MVLQKPLAIRHHLVLTIGIYYTEMRNEDRKAFPKWTKPGCSPAQGISFRGRPRVREEVRKRRGADSDKELMGHPDPEPR